MIDPKTFNPETLNLPTDFWTPIIPYTLHQGFKDHFFSRTKVCELKAKLGALAWSSQEHSEKPRTVAPSTQICRRTHEIPNACYVYLQCLI